MLGCGNLEFPARSVELAGDAHPEEIWGYALRYMQGPDVNPNLNVIPKAVTNASFIKEDVKKIWLEKVYKAKKSFKLLESGLIGA